MRTWICGAVFLSAAFALGCGGKSPTQPNVPASATLTIGVASGTAPQFVALTQTKQFVATLVAAGGTSQDITNVSVWQSSDTLVATVSAFGLVTAVGFGSADIRGTYGGKTGALAVRVAPGCLITLAPPALTFSAFGVSSKSVTVTVLPTDCRWRADSDAAWLPLAYDPNVSGNGSFNYPVPVNNYPSDRTASIVVTASDGSTAVHAVRQEKPVSCSLVLDPFEASFPSSVGRGSFTVTATPQECEWTAAPESASTSQFVRIDQGASGVGNGTVTYDVAANGYTSDRTYGILVRTSPENPPARFTVKIARR